MPLSRRLRGAPPPRRAPLLLLTLPLAALSLACGGVLLCACGGDGGLPTGSWHPYGSSGTGAPTGGTVGGSNGSTNGGSSSSGGSASNGTSSGGSSSSGGAGSSGSSGASSGSSGSSGSSSGSPMQPAPMLGVSVDKPTVKSQLLADTTVHVSIAPNGYVGTANLALASMPTGVTGKFDQPMVALDGRTTAALTLTLSTADSAPPGDTNLEVDAMAAGTTAKTTIAFTVQSVITLHIPAGVNNMGGSVSNPVTTAYGPYPIKITAPQGLSDQNPVTVYFVNDDSVSHEIHASNDQQGFAHDPGPIPPMSTDSLVRNVNSTGSFPFYLHDQGAPITVGLVEVQ